MDDASILDLDPAEETEVEKQVLGIFADDALDLLENIIKDDLGGLFLKLRQLGNRRSVELDGGEGEVDLVLHLHAILDQKFLHDAEDHLLAALLCRLRTQLH